MESSGGWGERPLQGNVSFLLKIPNRLGFYNELVSFSPFLFLFLNNNLFLFLLKNNKDKEICLFDFWGNLFYLGAFSRLK